MNPLDSLANAIRMCVQAALDEASMRCNPRLREPNHPQTVRWMALHQVARELTRIQYAVLGIDHVASISDPFLDAIRAGAEPETHGRTPTTDEIEEARNHRQPTPADLTEIDGD